MAEHHPNFEKGKKLVAWFTNIKASVNNFFEDIQRKLITNQNLFIDKDELLIQKFGRHRFRKLLHDPHSLEPLILNAINMAREVITTTFLGFVDSLCPRGSRSLISGPDTHIQEGWKFLQNFFVQWGNNRTWGEFTDPVILMISSNGRHTPDWTNPRDSLYHCMLFTKTNKPPKSLIQYLSKQWLASLI